MGLLFVTDLDGTLLDHADYSYAEALPALNALKDAQIPLVLATSKTAAEVAQLHKELALGTTPAIVENGAGVFRPGAEEDGGVSAYTQILETLADMPTDISGGFEGFAQMGDARVAALTNLPPDPAKCARQRAYSEPGLWTGTEGDLVRFLDYLTAAGLTARQGGRFLTISHGRTKADAMAEVGETLGATKIVALGDAPNDVEMLSRADIGVIIANPHGTPIPTLPGEAEGRIRRSPLAGPAGWNMSVLGILEELGAH